jgi:hypothetical protein
MTPDELVPDSQLDTRPDAPIPIRSDFAAQREADVDDVLRTIIRRPGRMTDALAVELRKCRSEFRSWNLSPPTAEVRARVLKRFASLRLQAGAGREES